MAPSAHAPEAHEDVSATMLATRPAVLLSLSLAFVLGLVAFGAFHAGLLGPVASFGVHVSVLAVLGIHAHLTGLALARRERVTLRAARSGLQVLGTKRTRTLTREAIHGGYFQPHASGDPSRGTLRLLGRHRAQLEAEIDAGSAQLVLRALGLDATAQHASFSAAAPLLATLPRQLVALLPLLVASSSVGLWMLLPWLGVAMWPSRILVGTDGFELRWLFWRRFVSITDIVAVEPEADRGILLRLRDGKTRVWYTSMRQRGTPPDRIEYRDAVLQRMREALGVAERRAGASRIALQLGRAGRPFEAWLGALQQLRRGTDYRTAALSRDELWRVLEDPAAADDARAAAAFLLRAGSSADEIRRLRDAAHATVSAPLRVALDDLAVDEEADPERAQAALMRL